MCHLILRLLLLSLALALHAPAGWAQLDASAGAGTNVFLPADDPDYYLFQAYHANSPDTRIALWHIGLLSQWQNDGHVVSAVLDGFPAQQAGLRRGDRLLLVDGAPFHPVRSFNETANPQIGDGNGAPDTRPTYRLEYARNGNHQSVDIQPVHGNLYDAFRSATLDSSQQLVNGNKIIGYLKLWSLDRSSDGLISYHRLLESLRHCDGLILDLRDSFGFVSAIHLDAFIANRTSYPAIENGGPALWPASHAARLSGAYYDRPLVVIQNHHTRAGMEVFAHQLASLGRVVSVGETTAGMAGTFSISGDTMTYRPAPETRLDGVQLEANGVQPERQISYPLDESLPVDPQFDGAMLTLMSLL